MAKIIAIANQKGGVAKTTTTLNIAVGLAQKGKKVLMVDFDSQASLTIAAGIEPEDYEANCIVQVISEPDKRTSDFKPITACIVQTRNENVWLVPSIIDLADMEWQMFSRINRESILKNALQPIVDDFDYILIDCPPALGILTINAFAGADSILIASSTEYLSYRGLKNLYKTMRQVKTSINKNLEVLGVIATRHKLRTRNKEILSLTMANFPVITVTKELAAAEDGIYEGISVMESNPTSEISLAYKEVVEMIVNDDFKTITEWNWSDDRNEFGQEK